MKNLKVFALLFVLAVIGMTSCTKDSVTENDQTSVTPEPTTNTSNNLIGMVSPLTDGLDLACFSIPYPFELNVDGTVVAINNEDEFTSSVTSGTAIDFVYPFTITHEDGTSEEIADADALGVAFASCAPTDNWENEVPVFLVTDEDFCYSLVYPVGVANQFGEAATINSDEELVELVVASMDTMWHFTYPLNVVDGDGTTTTVEGATQFFDLLWACNNEVPTGTGIFGCYDIAMPFSVTLEDGSTVVINSDDDFWGTAMNGNMVSFVYPLTLVGTDGTQLVVNSDDEMQEALSACEGFEYQIYDNLLLHSSAFAEPGQAACYNISYPFDITFDGNTVSLTSTEDAMSYMGMDDITIQYPITVVMVSTSETVTINSDDELSTLIGGCE